MVHDILIACEFSGIVREAFRKKGHNAWSCDLLPSEIPGDHFLADVQEVLRAAEKGRWDMIIMFPPCTCICASGNATYAKGKVKHKERLKAVSWTVKIWNRAKEICGKVCLENPVGVLSTLGHMGKPQYIQPWQFGHPESKKTGLWLHGLPELKPTNTVEPKYIRLKNSRPVYNNQTDSGQNRLAPGKDRWKIRSRTYQGIADAMADQFI